MNRRQMVMGCAVLPAIMASRFALAAPEEPEQVPITPTAAASPAASLPPFTGDVIRALQSSPWELEGMLLEFSVIVRNRFTADPGNGFLVGTERRDIYRSLLITLDPISEVKVMVATNADVTTIEDRHTALVTGVYGGVHDYYDDAVNGVWTVPLVIASRVEAVPPAARD